MSSEGIFAEANPPSEVGPPNEVVWTAVEPNPPKVVCPNNPPKGIVVGGGGVIEPKNPPKVSPPFVVEVGPEPSKGLVVVVGAIPNSPEEGDADCWTVADESSPSPLLGDVFNELANLLMCVGTVETLSTK